MDQAFNDKAVIFKSVSKFSFFYLLVHGLPTWGTCTLGVHLPIWSGTFKASNSKETIVIYYLFPNIYTYISKYYFEEALYAYC